MEDSGIDSGDTKIEYKNADEKGLSTSDSSVGSTNGVVSPRSGSNNLSNGSSTNYTSRQLQRRLEQRIESARRLHLPLHQQQSNTNATSNATAPAPLIPIQRLPIPHSKEQQPLVEWDTDDSEEEVVNFFPPPRSKDSRVQQELTDTFSIEEMSISGAEDDDEDDLHLVPPLSNRYNTYFRCCPFTSGSSSNTSASKCSIM